MPHLAPIRIRRDIKQNPVPPETAAPYHFVNPLFYIINAEKHPLWCEARDESSKARAEKVGSKGPETGSEGSDEAGGDEEGVHLQ